MDVSSLVLGCPIGVEETPSGTNASPDLGRVSRRGCSDCVVSASREKELGLLSVSEVRSSVVGIRTCAACSKKDTQN